MSTHIRTNILFLITNNISGYRSVVPGVIRVKEEQVNHRKRSKSKRPPTVQGVVRVREEQVNDNKSSKSSKRMKTPPKTVS